MMAIKAAEAWFNRFSNGHNTTLSGEPEVLRIFMFIQGIRLQHHHVPGYIDRGWNVVYISD